MEWSTTQVVEATGITSRTLRYYDRIGLLLPSRTGAGGLRYYNQQALIRLQRILLLRQLGMPLAEISQVLDGQTSDIKALLEQRQRLQITQEQIAMQIRSVDATIAGLEKGQTIMPQDMFAGFNHAKYDAEVRERWGDAAADRSNAWWSDLGTSGQEDFRQQLEALNSGWDEIIAAGVEPDAESAQQMAARHIDWLSLTIPRDELSKAKVKGITQMYVDDERFAANYNRVSPAGPQFVRDAIHHWADHHLSD